MPCIVGTRALAGDRRGGGGRPRATDPAQALVGPDRLRRARGSLRGERRRVQGAEGPPGGEPRRGCRAPPQAALALPAVGPGAAVRGLRASGEPPTAAAGLSSGSSGRNETASREARGV